MRVLIVGGVYDAEKAVQDSQFWAPEKALAGGLRQLGVDVDELGHRSLVREGVDPSYDVVHVHHAGPAALGIGRRPRSRTKLVFTFHAGRLPRSPKLLGATIVTGSMADAVVALGPCEQARWKRWKRTVDAIPNALDVRLFTAARHLRTLGGKVRLLYVGSILPVKRVDRIVEAFGLLRLNGLDAELEIVSHNREMEDEIVAMRQYQTNADRIAWSTPKRFGDVASAYANAHLLLLASESEGRPSVISEGLMTGLPVVAPDVGEVRGQVRDGGVVCDTGNSRLIARGVATALGEYERMASAAVRVGDIESRSCNPLAIARRHVDLYRRVLGDRVA